MHRANDQTKNWNLEHKGALKDFAGDRKAYKQWAKKVKAFCNSKQPGFRKALIWAEKLREPITDTDLQNTGWEHIAAANTRLYDLLITITSLGGASES